MTGSETHAFRWFGLALVASLLLTAGCTTSRDTERVGDRFVAAGEMRLVAFDSCDSAAEELRAATLAHVGPWGLDTGRAAAGFAEEDAALAAPPGAGDGAAAPEGAGDAAAGAGARVTSPQAPAHSGTNVHEAGVDEPDLVKTDGRRIVTVADGVLRVVDAQRRVETGTVRLHDDGEQRYDWLPADLLLHGDRALVLVQEHWLGPAGDTSMLPMPQPALGPRLLLVDIAGAPRILAEYEVDGSLIDARAVGPTVRVVVRSGARLEFPTLDHTADEQERLAANREVVRSAELTDWLPRYRVVKPDGTTRAGQVECTAMSRPASFSGTSMLTVLTFDLASATIGDGDPVSVVADGDTVYSNGESLYVAADQRWRTMARGEDGVQRPDERTEIYKFDTSRPGPPRYVASGAVDGWLINQYAMSEWHGHLRVATTTGDQWWGGEQPESESAVHVLAQQDGELVEIGSVGGLGHGERIYSVRFAGPVGYVVTFRETDPLYTVDLRDPSAPAVRGELKITGYSAYLHPIDAEHVLGIGQEADTNGVVQGTQLSLFDVSDLGDPRVRAQHHVRAGHSEAEFDPHAFLWWPEERLVVVPLMGPGAAWDGGEPDSGRAHPVPQSGALVLRLSGGDLTELDLITHPDGGQWGQGAPIRRSLVIGDTLWTVSPAGLQANRLPTLDTIAWLPFR